MAKTQRKNSPTGRPTDKDKGDYRVTVSVSVTVQDAENQADAENRALELTVGKLDARLKPNGVVTRALKRHADPMSLHDYLGHLDEQIGKIETRLRQRQPEFASLLDLYVARREVVAALAETGE